jgi:periplasmic divalent cation tolerance protein
VVLCTCGSEAEARRIAGDLLERHLCACANIIAGVESVYRWQGKVETSREWLLVIKTRAELTQQVQEAVRELHSYENPEAIALPVTDGLQRYLDWITTETRLPTPGT